MRRVQRLVLRPAARGAAPVAARAVPSVAVYMNRAQQDIIVHMMPLHVLVPNMVQNTVHNMAPVMEHVTVPSMVPSMAPIPAVATSM